MNCFSSVQCMSLRNILHLGSLGSVSFIYPRLLLFTSMIKLNSHLERDFGNLGLYFLTLKLPTDVLLCILFEYAFKKFHFLLLQLMFIYVLLVRLYLLPNQTIVDRLTLQMQKLPKPLARNM